MPQSAKRNRQRPGRRQRTPLEDRMAELEQERMTIFSTLDGMFSDELPGWVEPDNLEPPPDAGCELLAATADALLVQIKLLEELITAESNPHIILAYMGCIQPSLSNTEYIEDLLKNTATGFDSQEQAGQISARLEQSQHNFGRNTINCNMMFQDEDPDPAALKEALEEIQELAHETVSTVTEGMLRACAEAMRHCAWKSSGNVTPATKDAYTEVLFRLYNSTQSAAEETMQTEDITLSEAASQAIVQCQEIRDRQMEKLLRRDMPAKLGPAFGKVTEAIKEMAQQLQVEPAGFEFGIFTDPETIPHMEYPDEKDKYLPYIAYRHEGKVFVQGLGDSYPEGYPRELVVHQMIQVAGEITHPNPWMEIESVRQAMLQAKLADAGAHCVTEAGMQTLNAQARNLRMSDGAILHAVLGAVEFDEEIAVYLMKQGGIPEPVITKDKAQTVVNAGRETGLDEHQLAELCDAMLWEPKELNVRPPALRRKHIRTLLAAARRAGFDEEAVLSMEYTLSEY